MREFGIHKSIPVCWCVIRAQVLVCSRFDRVPLLRKQELRGYMPRFSLSLLMLNDIYTGTVACDIAAHIGTDVLIGIIYVADL